MKKRKICLLGLTTLLASVMITGSLTNIKEKESNTSTVTKQLLSDQEATTTTSSIREGLWLTEIFPNDFDTESNTHFGSKDDRLEFVEVTNTTKNIINFNENYDLLYGTTKDLATSNTLIDTITINPGESVVLWNIRTDIEETDTLKQGSIEDFKKQFTLEDSVKIFKIHYDGGYANNGYFAIKNKSTNEVLSEVTYKNGTIDITDGGDIADGLGADLGIPDFGNTMVYIRRKAYANPGYVYGNQLGGNSYAPNNLSPQGLYLTEIYSNDKNRDSVYGSSSNDLMEFVEITNTTDADIDFNTSYKLNYLYKTQISRMLITTIDDAHKLATGEVSENDELYNKTGIVIKAHKTAVFWCYRERFSTTSKPLFTTMPTLADFKTTMGISDDVDVYALNRNGIANTDRGFSITKTINGSDHVESYFYYDGVNDIKDGKSVTLKVQAEGTQMSSYQVQVAPTPGVISNDQITFKPDDNTFPTVTLANDEYDKDLLDVLTNGLDEGQSLRIPYFYKGSDNLNITYAELYYKTDLMDNYEINKTSSFAIYNKWYAFIEQGYLAGASKVDYYFKFHNDYRTYQSDVTHIKINKNTNSDSLTGLNANGKDITTNNYSKDVTLTSNKDSKIYLDNQELQTSSMFERGAYFTFDYTGVDSYFKNGVTYGGDTKDDGEVISIFAKCNVLPSTGRLGVLIDNKYFSYNSDGTITLTLNIKPGTFGSTFESYTDENNDDFTVSNLKLVLPNGTVIEPSSLYGRNVTTLEESAVENSSSIKMGDTDNYNINLKATFVISAYDLEACGISIDTTTLTDGAHTLKVVNGESSKEYIFNVKNTPDIVIEETKPSFGANLTIDSSYGLESPDNITVYSCSSIESYKRYDGSGDVISLVESSKNKTESDNGEYPYQVFEFKTTSKNDILVNFDYEINYSSDLICYVYNFTTGKYESVDISVSDGHATLLIDSKYIDGDTVRLLVSARGNEYGLALEDLSKRTDTVNNFTGQRTEDAIYGQPSSYDFSFAWITDTQYYSEQYQSNYSAMIDWIIENEKNLNIKYVMHTGDIGDEFNEEYQYAYARSQQDRLLNLNIASGVLGGNHDVAHGNEVYDNYYKYFNENVFNKYGWYGGSYKNNLGHYDIINSNGMEILMLYISWDIYEDEVKWMNSVLDAHPNTKAFIATHGGVNATGTESYTSRYLLNNVCKNHENVIGILNGHFHGSSINTETLTTDSGVEHTVYQICTDYQSAPEGGSGYIKMLYFDLKNNKIYLNSYSPVLDDVNYYDEKDMTNYDGSDIVEYDIDRLQLPVDFDYTLNKSLTIDSLSLFELSNTSVGTISSNKLTDLENGYYYGVKYDENGNILSYTNAVKVNKNTTPLPDNQEGVTPTSTNNTPASTNNTPAESKPSSNDNISTDKTSQSESTEDKKDNNGLSGGAITGIVIASITVVGILGFAIFKFLIKKH